MYFATAAAVLLSVSTALAQTVWPVTVGDNGTLTYSPNQVNVSAGDIVTFTL